MQVLGDRVTPTNAGGNLLPLAIRVADNHQNFSAAWYSGPAEQTEVFHLPPNERPFERGTDWKMPFTNHVRREPSWPWKLALEQITSNVKHLLGSYKLTVPDGPLVEEVIWNVACRMLDRTPWRGQPIALESIPDMAGAPAEALLGSLFGPQVTVQRFRDALRDLRLAGSEELLPPWPVPDFPFPERKHDLAWNLYSPERLRDRLNIVIHKALVAYMQLAEYWFPRVQQHLAIAVTCPARIEGQIRWRFPGSDETRDSPQGFWYLRPIAQNEEIQSDIRLVFQRLQWSPGTDQEMLGELLQYRPHAAGWIPFVRHGTGGDDCLQKYPVTTLAHQLLAQDLTRIGLCHGTTHPPL